MENRKKSVTLTIGWILLLLLGLVIAGGGVASLLVAYRGADDPIVGVKLERMAEVHPDLPKALRGRRATASSFAISYGILLMWVAATAYKRAEKWAWYSSLTSLGFGSLLSLLRVPVLDTTLGVPVAGGLLAILAIALAVSYRDFK